VSAFAAGYAGWFTDEIKIRIGSGKMRAEAKGKSIRDSLRGSSGGKKGGQLWRVAQGSRSAFFKKIRNAGTHHPSQLAGQMAYINGKAKEIFGNSFDVVEGAKALDKEAVSGLVERWSDGWSKDKSNTKNGYTSHMVVSFPDDVTDSKAAAITQTWCEDILESRTFVDDEWQYYAALHTDTANPHVHIVINNRGADGNWFYLAKDHDLNNELLKEMLVDIAEDHGVFLDTSTRLERGKSTYAPPKIEFQQAKRLGIEPKERPMSPAALASAKEIMKQYADQVDAMIEVTAVMNMPNVHDALCAAAVSLRDGKPVDVTAFLKEEELVHLDLTQHPVDIRQAIVNWSADNADRIANAEPVKRDRFVHEWIKAIDKLDQMIAPDDGNELQHMNGKPVKGVTYSGKFLDAAVGDKEHLVEASESLMPDGMVLDDLRKVVVSGEFGRFLHTGDMKPENTDVISVISTAYSQNSSGQVTDASEIIGEMKQRAKDVGLDPLHFEQRVLNGAYDERMEFEWVTEDVHVVMKAGDMDLSSDTDFKKAHATVTAVYDFVAQGIERLQSQHMTIALSRSDRDHSAFIEGADEIWKSIAIRKSVSFKSEDQERAFLKAFKDEFGDQALERLARGNTDDIREITPNENGRHDIAFAVFKMYSKHPDLGVSDKAIMSGLEYNHPSKQRELERGRGDNLEL